MVTPEQYLEAVKVINEFHSQVMEKVEQSKAAAGDVIHLYKEECLLLKGGDKIRIVGGLNGNVIKLRTGEVYEIGEPVFKFWENKTFRRCWFRIKLSNGRFYSNTPDGLLFQIA